MTFARTYASNRAVSAVLNALSCCALRFVELTAGDQTAPDWTYFSVMLMPENQTVMVGAELRHRVVASPAKRALL
ncbi:hypothetical protein FQG50_25020 [Escherichia coli]|nr:hypothetical protein BE930_01160 [Escherichia coli]EEU9482098.1 hypothetical protein [Escherichia coli]EEW2491154.1 hypothetical protein [Escherichia coli]EEW4295614.1 hypothetical protein [Escherichia coli]EFA5233084.1 hypothetical protein [Escherichia coli]